MPQTSLSRPSFITDAEHIKYTLKSARIGAGINQKDFARIMGKSQGWISQVEKGKTKITINEACWWLDNCNQRLMVCEK